MIALHPAQSDPGTAQQAHLRRLLRNGPWILALSAVFFMLGMIFSHSPPSLPIIFFLAGVLQVKLLLWACQNKRTQWRDYLLIFVCVVNAGAVNHAMASSWWEMLITFLYWQACFAGAISLLLTLFREQFSRFVETLQP